MRVEQGVPVGPPGNAPAPLHRLTSRHTNPPLHRPIDVSRFTGPPFPSLPRPQNVRDNVHKVCLWPAWKCSGGPIGSHIQAHQPPLNDFYPMMPKVRLSPAWKCRVLHVQAHQPSPLGPHRPPTLSPWAAPSPSCLRRCISPPPRGWTSPAAVPASTIASATSRAAQRVRTHPLSWPYLGPI